MGQRQAGSDGRWRSCTIWRRHSELLEQPSPRRSALTDSVGDITPVEGVPSHVKHQLEEAAMDSFLNEMLGGESNKEARERFRSLWDVC